MTKHAIEAYTDSLAQQMADLGVRGERDRAWRLQERNPPKRRKHLGMYEDPTLLKEYRNLPDGSQDKPPDEVAEAVEHALSTATSTTRATAPCTSRGLRSTSPTTSGITTMTVTTMMVTTIVAITVTATTTTEAAPLNPS